MGDGRDTRMTLGALVRAADRKVLPEGWFYLPDGSIGAETEVLFVPTPDYGGRVVDDSEVDEEEARVAALGFPRGGLDTATLEAAVVWTRQLTPDPTNDEFVKIVLYYGEFDTFPETIDAPPPPPIDESRRLMDLQFYKSLGAERAGTACRREGCTRGTVAFSAFCAAHHFENVWGRPWTGGP